MRARSRLALTASLAATMSGAVVFAEREAPGAAVPRVLMKGVQSLPVTGWAAILRRFAALHNRRRQVCPGG